MRRALSVLLAVLAGAGFAESFWTPRKLVGTYQNWDYWWLNVRIGIDRFDTIYCAVARYNYSQSDPEHDLYVLNDDGDTVRTERPWHGYEYQPIVQDAEERNIYVGQPLLGFAVSGSYHMDAGVADDSNTVSTTNSCNDTVYFTRLGAGGGRLVWRDAIYSGNPWSGRTSLALDPRGWLHCTFADDIEHPVYGVSTDKGTSWTWDTLASQRVMSHVRVAATPDTCLHIVYRTWTSGVQLRYLKLRPDGSLAVGSSVFSDGSERWCPNVAVDTGGDLRVVFVDGATNAQNLYYTELRGDLDNSGQPVPDSVLSLVPDAVIETDPVRIAGPKVCVDSRDRAQVLFEQGEYGSGGTKHVYHIREDAGQPVEEAAGAGPQQVGEVRVMPNPLRVSGVVRFDSGGAGQVHVVLRDVAGRGVREWTSGRAGPGPDALRIDRGQLPAGVYFLEVEASGDRHLPVEMRRVKVIFADRTLLP